VLHAVDVVLLEQKHTKASGCKYRADNGKNSYDAKSNAVDELIQEDAGFPFKETRQTKYLANFYSKCFYFYAVTLNLRSIVVYARHGFILERSQCYNNC